MITLNLKKVYFTTHTVEDPYRYVDSYGIPATISGVVSHDCEEQKFDHVGDNEQIIVTVDKIPFIKFEIIYAPLTDRYLLSSVSPISLRTYTEQGCKVEKWGDYDSVGKCVDKCISVVAGFINGMGKEEVNDGNYYKD
jgi:hypothetical protein